MAVRALSRVLAALSALGVAPAPLAASLRCEGGVVTRGDSVEVVRARCGAPDHRSGYQRRSEAPSARNPRAFRLTDVETWTYRRGYGRFVQHLTFEGGRLVRIERGPREE